MSPSFFVCLVIRINLFGIMLHVKGARIVFSRYILDGDKGNSGDK